MSADATVADVLAGAARWCVICADNAGVLAGMADGCVDHVITDPPYDAEAHTMMRRIRGAGDPNNGRVLDVAPLDFRPMTEKERCAAGLEISRLSRRWMLVFCQAEAVGAWRAAMVGAKWKRSCIWLKPDGQPQLSGDRPGMGYESIACAHAPGRTRWNGHGRHGIFQHSVKADARQTKADHPTTKPLALMSELVDLFTDPDEIILDPFAGSGTTGVAAVRAGRRCIMIEREHKYAAVARERMAAEESGSTLRASRAGQVAMFPTGSTK